MKKYIALLLTLILLMSLTACGSKSDNTPATNPDTNPVPAQDQEGASGAEKAAEPELEIEYIPDTDFLMPGSVKYLEPRLFSVKVTDQRGVMNSTKLYVGVHFNIADDKMREEEKNKIVEAYEAYLKEQFPSGEDSHGNKITTRLTTREGDDWEYYEILVVYPS